jgi:hypothetical protein
MEFEFLNRVTWMVVLVCLAAALAGALLRTG